MRLNLSILAAILLIVVLPMESIAKGKGNDHIGNYNFMVEIDGVAASAYGLGEPNVISFPVFESETERTDIELQLSNPTLSFNPELREKLDELIAKKGLSIIVVDVRTGQQMMRADYRGRIKRIRIRERASGANYRRGGEPTESISLTYSSIEIKY